MVIASFFFLVRFNGFVFGLGLCFSFGGLMNGFVHDEKSKILCELVSNNILLGLEFKVFEGFFIDPSEKSL